MKELEDERAELIQRKGAVAGVIQNPDNKLRSSVQGPNRSPSRQNQSMDDSKGNEDMINFLEHKLEEIEKKLSTTQSQYEQLQNEYMEMQDKLS